LIKAELKNNWIICIGFPKWEGNYAKSSVMLMKQLALNYRVVYVDYQHTLKDLIFGLFFRNTNIPVKRLMGLEDRLTCKDNVYILTPPPVLPINWIRNKTIYHALLKVNNRIVRSAIRKAIKKLDIHNPAVVNAFNPFFGIYNRGKLNESCHIYYCYDEIGHAKWMNRHGERLEAKFAQKVDAVIATSKPLLQKLSARNKHVYLIENGVDFDLFNRYASPKETPSIQIVGYTGSIDERLDFEYIEKLASLLPDVRFKFVGRITGDGLVKNLEKLNNVEFEPPVDYNRLPAILSEFDLCLIPFVKNEFTRNIYPMKINEYLAAGKLTLMTNFAALPEFDDIVFKEDSPEQAATRIRNINLLDPNIRGRIDRGIALAKSNSWASRSAGFIRIIEKHSNHQTTA